MKDRCPSCKQEINIGKSKLIDCPHCDRKVLSVMVNGKVKILDVTPKEELKK